MEQIIFQVSLDWDVAKRCKMLHLYCVVDAVV
jgi:hypothetical protein